ncbi:MAG: D-2-hydroxyacid dehydrogenase [Acidobacteria bacterium]|nr:D-2-hydroxyacid dehydrogenase [Acidobacteriota bacterium]
MSRLTLLFVLTAALLPAQTKKILAWNTPPEGVRELQGITDKARIVAVSKENVMQEIADADAFLGDITPELVRAGKKLKWVQTRSAGVERSLHLSGGNDLRDSNIILTNNQIVQGPEIADHAMAMLLSLTRGLPGFIEMRKQGRWQARRGALLELNGRTAVIIGLGGIGQQIAMRAWAHGMRVIGVDPEDIPYSPFWPRVVKPDQLDEVVPEADVIFISAPHTTMSHKMMGARQFDMMKRDSFFIAVSRGGIYDMNALVKALDSRRLAGAGVDVTDPEPLPEGHPLWKFDNVIITPHIAGRSDKDAARMTNTIKENIKRFCDGRPLINVVDKQKGY